MMKSEILNKILKDILFLKDTKVEKNFKIGELIEGKILKKLENYLIIHLKNKGTVKAFTKIPINSEKILLKVVSDSSPPELKIISELPGNIDFEQLKNIFSYSKKQIPIKNGRNIFINQNEITNSEILQKIIKKIPEKLGITYEKDILTKKEVSDSLKKDALQHKNIELLNYIESFQKINNHNLLFFPLFFNNIKNFKKGFVGIKKNPLKKNLFSVLIDLDLDNDVNIQTFIISQDKNLQITFSTNKSEFLSMIKLHSKQLIKDIESISNYKVMNISFKLYSDDESFRNTINFLKMEDSIIIDIKT